jgi:hypothetical protein
MIRILSLSLVLAHLFVVVVPCVGAPAEVRAKEGHSHGMNHGAAMAGHASQGGAGAEEAPPSIRSQCMCGCGAKSDSAPAGYARVGVTLPPAQLIAFVELPPTVALLSTPAIRTGHTRMPDPVPIPS